MSYMSERLPLGSRVCTLKSGQVKSLIGDLKKSCDILETEHKCYVAGTAARKQCKFDITELFAGNAGITHAAVQQNLRAGPPLDLNTGYNFMSKADRFATKEYFATTGSGLFLWVYLAPNGVSLTKT